MLNKLDTDIENTIASEVERATRDIEQAAKPLAPQRHLNINDAAAGLAGISDHVEIRRFLESGERLYQKHRRKMADAESRFGLDRAKMIESYRQKLRDLQHEAAEALRAHDRLYATQRADDERILAALAAMRDCDRDDKQPS